MNIRTINIEVEHRGEKAFIEGDLIEGSNDKVIIFAHGSGSSRFSHRNRFVANVLNKHGFNTLLLDLLTRNEDAIDNITREYRFNIDLLADRLIAAVRWLDYPSIGYFGASTGAAAALIAYARYNDNVKAIVSRGGRIDLAKSYLAKVNIPTLLIVGGKDEVVLQLNKESMQYFNAEVRLEIIPNASHLFEEPNALEQVAELAKNWFEKHL